MITGLGKHIMLLKDHILPIFKVKMEGYVSIPENLVKTNNQVNKRFETTR